MTPTRTKEFRLALETNAERYNLELQPNSIERLSRYYELLLIWNPRLHLVAPCSPTEFAKRHVLESLMLQPHLTKDARVADIGSGAGLPIIPNLIVRPDVQATLIEASPKKCVFLREAVAATGIQQQANVLAKRFEDTEDIDVDFVTCRALDRFSELLPALIDWAPEAATFLFFGGESLRKNLDQMGLKVEAVKVPESERRWLFVVR
ncbi:MAG TPA: 16S rRNA (guanine(527)-N(7))-methyltransferase RsmG [Pyrinomonadaceae bacterium]|jgi:16S rRNA (guanine527-N7)-methyltransferase|nr:16S rRNA (guanine(527)-N(7))-methyltransferase RsmG [Pyrinomonadaceae bacterium]